MQTKSYTINTQETSKYLITHSTVLTQTSILTVWSPGVITTGRCTVRASPTRVTLTAVSSSAGALSIHRVTMCTINTGAWDGAVSSPVTLDTRLVTELTWITTNTDAKSYDKKSHWSPDSITYSRTYFKLGYLKLPLSFSLYFSFIHLLLPISNCRYPVYWTSYTMYHCKDFSSTACKWFNFYTSNAMLC